MLPMMAASGMFGKRGGGLDPMLAMLSPMGFGMAKHPEYALPMMSPGLGGLAHLLGIFKK